MTNKKQKYIITLLVDNREWNSQPIEGELGNLQSCLLYTSDAADEE